MAVITNAEIIYTMDGGILWQTVIMTECVDDIWTGTIPGPGVNENVHVFYYISATDDGIDQCPDINEDGIINVLDIVQAVNLILDNQYNQLADLNQDDLVNILDIVILVNLILE